MPTEDLPAPVTGDDLRMIGGEILFSLYDTGVRSFVHLYGEFQTRRIPTSNALAKLKALDERCKDIKAEIERRLRIADGRVVYDRQHARG